ncbi:trypsin-like serine protease [Streptomyces sp. NPDC006129]|uniref:trypsin-like serine protease n=1 Tax=Streptomyces sp. NPDC006129 TaxID=3155348 RepID=UPI0033B0CD4E
MLNGSFASTGFMFRLARTDRTVNAGNPRNDGVVPAWASTTSSKVAATAICRGDSGDPAVVNGSVKGIAIEDRGCGKSGEPAIFTDIAPLSDWLRWQ